MSENTPSLNTRRASYVGQLEKALCDAFVNAPLGMINRNAALAVAAQVLRDVIATFPENEPLYHSWGGEIDVRDRIEQFAAERGIDLEAGS